MNTPTAAEQRMMDAFPGSTLAEAQARIKDVADRRAAGEFRPRHLIRESNPDSPLYGFYRLPKARRKLAQVQP